MFETDCPLILKQNTTLISGVANVSLSVVNVKYQLYGDTNVIVMSCCLSAWRVAFI